jgi:hypothetical protein
MTRLKRGNWSTHDLERLRTLYPRSREESVARLLRRSIPSVQRKAREIFATTVAPKEWTAGDDLRLREGFGILDFPSLCLVLGRTAADVSARVQLLRAWVRADRRWQRVEFALLKRLYGSRSDEDLVVCLSRPIEQIRARAADLCLSKDKGFLAHAGDATERLPQRMPRWNPREIRMLRDLYPTTLNLALAQRLRRSVASVANKANQLGLKKSPAVLREMGRRNVAARYRGSEESGL